MTEMTGTLMRVSNASTSAPAREDFHHSSPNSAVQLPLVAPLVPLAHPP